MTDKMMLLAVFPDIDPAATGLRKLRALGVDDADINILAGIPITEAMFGRKKVNSHVPLFALGGAIAGFLIGLYFAIGTPHSYPIFVGGQPLVAVPPSIVVVFEMTMLLMLVSTFLGVFLDSRYPSYEPKEYVTEVSEGKIAVIFPCPAEKQKEFSDVLIAQGAESVEVAEAKQL